MKNIITSAIVIAAAGLFGCNGTSAQQVVNTVVNLSNEACTLISQDDPTAPTSVQVVCKIENQASPVVVNLPWNAWQALVAGQTDASAPAAARTRITTTTTTTQTKTTR